MNVQILPVSERISDEARQAIIEHRRLMKAQRKYAAENAERIAAEWGALTDPMQEIRRDVAAAKVRADAEWNAMDELGRALS